MHEIKNTLACVLSQAKDKKSPQKIAFRDRKRVNGKPVVHLNNWLKSNLIFSGTDEEFLALTRTLTNTDKDILSHLIHFRARGLRAFMSQAYIAKKIGRNVTYVNERLNRMMRLGLLDIYHRSTPTRKISNIYKLAHHFLDANYWKQLDFIPAIKSMCLGLLLLCPILQALPAHRPSLKNFPNLLDIKKNLFINNNLTDSKKESKMQQEYPKKGKSSTNFYPTEDFLALKSLTRQLHSVRSAENVHRSDQERLKFLEKERNDPKTLEKERIAAENLKKIWG